MKKLITSVGALALGAVGVQAAYAPGLSSMETSKPWSVSASLRGFYDDNYATSPTGLKRESFGIDVSPSASLNLPMDQTFVGLSYVYSMRWFEDRDKDVGGQSQDSIDHTHQFSGKLDHAFSERYKISLEDSFAIAQEPEILSPNGLIPFPLRVEGDNIRNTGSATFSVQLTPLLGVQLGYVNTLYDYEEKNANNYSARLDRIEHLGSINLRYQVTPQTIGVLGYQYGLVDYTSSDDLVVGGGTASPSDRNNRSHYVFVGADHNFNSQLNGSFRVGGRLTDYYNQAGVNNSSSPYADVNLTYIYAPGSLLQVGLRHDRNQTDQFMGTVGNLTVDQQSTSIYSSWTHQLTSKISGTLLAQYQHSTFEGGVADSDSDEIFLMGVNVGYRISQHWLAEAGYNFDRLSSDLNARSYSRNRAYIGIRATY